MRAVYCLPSPTGDASGRHNQGFDVVIVMLLLYTIWLGKSGCLVVGTTNGTTGGEETGGATQWYVCLTRSSGSELKVSFCHFEPSARSITTHCSS